MRERQGRDRERDAAAAARTAAAKLTKLLVTLACMHARMIVDQTEESLRESAGMIRSMSERLEKVENQGLAPVHGQARVLRALAAQMTDMAAELTATGRLVSDGSPDSRAQAELDAEPIVITDEMLDELFRSEQNKHHPRHGASDEDTFGLF